MEANKLLMPNRVEEACGLYSQGDSKSLFQTTTSTIDTYKNNVYGACWIPMISC
jgi:hypothetical protein